MDLPNKATSSLDEDLEVSSSDEEVESLSMNEDDLLRLSDGDEETGRPRTQASSSINLYTSTPAAGPSRAQENTGTLVKEYPTRNAEVEDGEIEYPDIPNGILSTNNVSRPGIEDLDLDEICRQRQIYAPPKGYRQKNWHRYHNEKRQVDGARNKMFNYDPRENVSLDDIIKRIPIVGLGRDHQKIHRRHHYGVGNGQNAAQQGQNEKLKKGVQSITEFHRELAKPILEPSEQAPEGYPEYRDEPWQCVKKLVSKGFSIYWSLKKLKNDENLNDEEESRLYRCLVSYNEVQGLCEASNMLQAKHGAALDLLGKLSKEFPNLGPFPEKLNEALLIKPSVFGTLITKMKEQHGSEYKYLFNASNDKIDNRALFSYLGAKSAKAMAIKMAYEDLLKEACPLVTIHLGLEQCTDDQSIYRGVESQMIHCYDFSRSVLVDSKIVRDEVKKAGCAGPSLPRRDTCVPVCHVRPQAEPKI